MPADPREFFSEIAEDYAEEHSLENHPEPYFELLEEFVELVGEGKVLDAGCGPGKDAEYFFREGFEVVGIDYAPGAIEYAEENRPGEFHVMDVRDLKFDDRIFHGVWCNTVMQFLEKSGMKEVVSELERVLKEGGVFYSTFKIGDGYIIRKEKGRETKRYLIPRHEVEEMLKNHGFEVVAKESSALNGLTVMNVFARKKNRD
jgi:ubiquinone/menaquinone biosynthesis C-methylase UbiE